MKKCNHCNKSIWPWQSIYSIELDEPFVYYHGSCGDKLSAENIDLVNLNPIAKSLGIEKEVVRQRRLTNILGELSLEELIWLEKCLPELIKIKRDE